MDPKCKVSLCVEQKTLDHHKSTTVSDSSSEIPLSVLDGLPPAPSVSKVFSNSSLKYADFERVLSTRRNASSPGLNGIPYKVYKNCPKISSFLFNVFKCCFNHCIVPIQWRHAMEVYIPKTKTPSNSNVKDFRPIALLNVEGKLFFSLLSHRLEKHIIQNNKFINSSVQKGCVDKVPGCWEHMSMVWSALKEAHLNRTDLSTIWLDVANAYGLIPHKLIFFALERYGVPANWISLVKKYYAGIFSKSFFQHAPSSWHKHERGIFAGCTLSIIIFLAGMNIILEYTLLSTAPSFVTSNKVSMPLVRAFMDDLNLLSSSVAGAQDLLARCTTALTWDGMDFRADKSRCFVVVKGKSMNSTPFCVSKPSDPTDFSSYIPSIHSMPIRFLGRTIDGSISDRKAIDELDQKLSSGLTMIDKSSFKGPQKLWILQHLLIPRIQWPLLIYEVSMCHAFKLEQKISTYIRKWLGLHRSTSSICFYSSSSPCPLPVKSLTSILKSCKISGHLLLRDSQDPLVSGNKIEIKSGQWKVGKAVESSESELRFRRIRGPPQFGKAGLGITTKKAMPTEKSSREYRKLISDTSKEIDEETNMSKALQLKVQGQWTRWENYVKNDISWKSVLAMPPNLLSFCLSSTYDVLPSPSNLKRWHICSEASCFLCGKEVCTTSHVLGACTTSLNQGRFTFRHDSVLTVIVESLASFINDLPPPPKANFHKVSFVKAGKFRAKVRAKETTGILHLANDWKLVSDLGNGFIFPGHIAITALRPDVVIFSDKLKRIIIIELTCPCEENMEHWHSMKFCKYSGLIHIISSNGWIVDFFAIEVGARGYCARSATSCLKKLGFTNKLAFSAAKKFGEASMKASFYIWLARNSKEWSVKLPNPPPLCTASSQTSSSALSSPKASVEPPTPSSTLSSQKPSTKPPTSSLKNLISDSASPASNVPKIKVCHAGLFNKGNTCYANSLLQALSVVPSLWAQWASESSQLSPLVKSISLNMSLLKRSSTPVDPSNFLRALARKVSVNRGIQFHFNTQQDVPEILKVILDELKGLSPIADSIFSTTICSTLSCDSCFCSSVKEEKLDILLLQPRKYISMSLNNFLQSESLTGDNQWHCPQCSVKRDCSKELSISSCGKILIVQLKRFSDHSGNSIKDTQQIHCLPEPTHSLTVPIKPSDSVSFSNRYSLIASINHSGTQQAGHYWAFIKNVNDNTWLKCNDQSVVVVPPSALNNKSCYVLFYTRI